MSVGNLTAGGTGKTPVVAWLARQLRTAGLRPAILMRGYKSQLGVSDEEHMLRSTLNDCTLNDAAPPIIVHANPNRFAGGVQVLADYPDTDLFILDDGFQHRRLAREFDLVLISAADPWGYGHVHPRGLLREPPHNLARASAILITHADEVSPETLASIEQSIRAHTAAPIYQASHHQTGYRTADGLHAMTELAGERIYAFCGIGHPSAFFTQLQSAGAISVGCRAFPDHHDYLPSDLTTIDTAAQSAGAKLLLTTAKDFARLAARSQAIQTKIPIGCVELALRFRNKDEMDLLALIIARCRTLSRSDDLRCVNTPS
jgi:tetraacyldisaccharide 4'-kinase